SPQQSLAQAVERSGVVRFRGQSGAKGGDGFGIFSLLRKYLGKINVGASVVWINFEHSFKRGDSVSWTTFSFGDQTKDVVRLRCIWTQGNRRLRFFLRPRQIRHVEKRNRQVDSRQRQLRIKLQRPAEGVGRLLVLKLLK